jgi:hypothetical protein
MIAAAGCSSAVRQDTRKLTPVQDSTRAQRLDHVMPARDFVGPAPTTFEWTPVAGADSYSVGIWNEVDMIVWRQNNITGTSVVRPADVRLEPGTYFWMVSALRGDDQIAESGLSAFVVRPSQ